MEFPQPAQESCKWTPSRVMQPDNQHYPGAREGLEDKWGGAHGFPKRLHWSQP